MVHKLETVSTLGADECAWGNLAGPFFCCAVAMTPANQVRATAIDSKKVKGFVKLSQLVRRNLQYVTAYSVIEIPADLLVSLGYSWARRYAFQAACHRVRRKMLRFPLATIDGADDFGVPRSRAIPKADAMFPTVSMASCIAKTRQLQYMDALDKQYPEYGFSSHAGYGTEQHVQALIDHGALPHIHRIPVIAKMFRSRSLTLKLRS